VDVMRKRKAPFSNDVIIDIGGHFPARSSMSKPTWRRMIPMPSRHILRHRRRRPASAASGQAGAVSSPSGMCGAAGVGPNVLSTRRLRSRGEARGSPSTAAAAGRAAGGYSGEPPCGGKLRGARE
jgi:hypothetical protein